MFEQGTVYAFTFSFLVNEGPRQFLFRQYAIGYIKHDAMKA